MFILISQPGVLYAAREDEKVLPKTFLPRVDGAHARTLARPAKNKNFAISHPQKFGREHWRRQPIIIIIILKARYFRRRICPQSAAMSQHHY
jgi:hypothetical protein